MLSFPQSSRRPPRHPGLEGSIASWGVIATGLWVLWVQLLALLVGGYSAGYLRGPMPQMALHENELASGLHGLVVWATGTVAVVVGSALAAAFASYVALARDTYQDPAAMTASEQNAAIVFAFALGAISLLSAVAAWWSASVAAEHRTIGTDFSWYVSFKR